MLEAKVSQLERDVVTAERIAQFWRKQITVHGEVKAEAFYTSLGLNHLQKQSVEWEGLTLCREPSDVEKLCIKSIAAAQDSSKATITPILMNLRTELIDSGMSAIKKLDPADYHTLVLEAPKALRTELRDQVDKVFMKGKRLVASELSAQKDAKQSQPTEDDDAELDDLADLTDSRVVNDVQSRITGAAARYTLLGLTGAALWKAISDELNTGSVSYIDRAATGLGNKVLNFGRSREMQDRSDEIGRYEYSAILDQNTCGPCAADDGLEASSPEDLPDTPNPECEGSDFCRCFVVAIAEGVH